MTTCLYPLHQDEMCPVTMPEAFDDDDFEDDYDDEDFEDDLEDDDLEDEDWDDEDEDEDWDDEDEDWDDGAEDYDESLATLTDEDGYPGEELDFCDQREHVMDEPSDTDEGGFV